MRYVKFVLNYSQELKTALKVYAANSNQTMNEVIVKAIETYINTIEKKVE